ncbi:hypothetical protein GCM10009414_25330 [Tatumella terrea]
MLWREYNGLHRKKPFGMSAGNGRNSQPVLAVPALTSPAVIAGRSQRLSHRRRIERHPHRALANRIAVKRREQAILL